MFSLTPKSKTSPAQYQLITFQKMDNNDDGKPHAIVFPYPMQGHLTPTLCLAIALASRSFTVTYIHTDFVHHAISESHAGDILAGARESGLDIRYATISDGFPIDYDRGIGNHDFRESFIRDFPARVESLVERILATSSRSAGGWDLFFLVADSLYSWPAAVAQKYGLVNVSVWTEAAAVFSINYHLDLLRRNAHFPYTGNGESDINYIPGIQSISTKDLMSYIRHPHDIPTVTNIAIKAFEQVKNADFILCNTVHELEIEALVSLNKKQPTYVVGPVNFFNNIANQIVHKISLWPPSDCIGWLDSKPSNSVLYISFGSIVRIGKREIREIAGGLMLSRVNFLWIMRTCSKDDDHADGDVFPVGFGDDLKERGLIVPWCNQSVVLSHPSVGGFLMHCGWNSVLESMWHCVPMICYPLLVDQPTNRKLVVDDWRIGVNACNQEQVSMEEFTSKVKLVMTGKTSIEKREKMKKAREVLGNALEIDGSSRKNFDQFVEDLKGKLKNKKKGDGNKGLINNSRLFKQLEECH